MNTEKFVSLEEFMDDIGLDIDTCVYSEGVITSIKKTFNNMKEDSFVKNTMSKLQKKQIKLFVKLKSYRPKKSNVLKKI